MTSMSLLAGRTVSSVLLFVALLMYLFVVVVCLYYFHFDSLQFFVITRLSESKVN